MKNGAIALVGKPNVGKSTIINNIFKEQVSIVNKKPQTTRNQISKIFQDNEYKILFIDTPGLLIHLLSVAIFSQRRGIWVVVVETLWPKKVKNVYCMCLYRKSLLTMLW